MNLKNKLTEQTKHYDAVVVGAGFSGLYMLHRLRETGLSVRVYEAAKGVGGVWYWNTYPGARCDTDSIYYNYTFSEELYNEWTWSERYSSQPEILRYLNYVADKFELREDIQFETRVSDAHFDNSTNQWDVNLDDGSVVTAKYFITGVGVLSTMNIPDFKGKDSFTGEAFHTADWPEKLDLEGKKVGVIGTGSSGVQSIPEIAKEVEHLTIFQRSGQFTAPANNYAYDEEDVKEIKANFKAMRRKMEQTYDGIPIDRPDRSVLDHTPKERNKVFQEAWDKGGVPYLLATYSDLKTNEKSNASMAKFVSSKIYDLVKDQELADDLQPVDYFGTKRPITHIGFYDALERDNVSFLNVTETPIEEITPNGIKTSESEHDLDVIIYATGFDAITGSLFRIDIRGKDGTSLKEKWADGEKTRTNLGLTTAGFPNMFIITGPESPSVTTNMPMAIEQHVDWIIDCINYLETNNIAAIEATVEAEDAWSTAVSDRANKTLFVKTKSWYTGGNIDGKSTRFPIYLGGMPKYGEIINNIAKNGYEGFDLTYQTEPVKN